ncbi:TolC family protein [Paracrocinitomix mangrovi]|uniref:TolC family protein n=1 Tax=Paracrocinitomix mangrovi TaxID=2862509 RepID=UPI001C8E1F9F|nr:TolC family protein [Paracrocinitomix mangrovi]UKN02249.1 TolC family protein [Paracrocinitomix mangrovi]
MKLVFTNVLILFLSSVNLYGQTWTLEQCIDSAYANNQRIAIAENTQELSALKHKEAKSNLLPKLSINGEYKYFIELPYQLMPLSVFGGPEGQFKEAQFGVPHNINANVLLQVPIYSSGLIGNINKLETSQKIVELEVKKTYDQIYFEVSNIYRNAQLLKSQMVFIDSTISNTERVKQNIELLAEQKLANQNDVKKLELKVSTLQSYKANLDVKLQQIYNALQLLTGSASAIEVEDNILMIDLMQYEDNGNKDIEIIQLQQEIINIDLKSLKQSKFISEVGFVATYGTQGFGYDQSPNQFLNFYPIGYAGIRFTYPLFNGTVTNKKIDQKNLELENLKLKEELTKDAQQVEIENAVLRLENAFNNVTLSEQQVDLAQSIYEQEEKKHKQGLISVNDLMIAQNELIQNQQNYLQSIAEFLAADLELKKLTNNISNN